MRRQLALALFALNRPLWALWLVASALTLLAGALALLGVVSWQAPLRWFLLALFLFGLRIGLALLTLAVDRDAARDEVNRSRAARGRPPV